MLTSSDALARREAFNNSVINNIVYFELLKGKK